MSEKIGQQSKRAAVIVGRFNPPTIGHYSVFDIVKKFIVKNKELNLDAVPIVVVIAGKETSKDKMKNPLSAEDRVMFMQASGRADGIKFMISTSAYEAFEDVRKAGFEPIAVAAGSDRGDKYLEMLDKYFKKNDGTPIKHYLISVSRVSESKAEESEKKLAAVDDVLKYVDKDLPASMVSASLARRAVQKDEFQKFVIITGLQKKIELAKKMFNKIKHAFGEQDGNS